MPKNRIKGITIQLDGDSTKLQTSLKGVTSEIRNTQSQLKDVEKLLKLDPGNTELLAQKHKLLGQAVEETKRKLSALKQANEQVSKTAGNYDAWKAKYDPIQQEITETQEKLKKLKEQAADADKQLAEGKISQEKYDAIQAELKETSDHLKDLKQQAKDVDEEFGHPVSPEQYDALQREIVETTAELKKLETQAQQSGTAVQDIAAKGEKLKDLGGKVAGVGQALLPVTGAVVGLGTAAVKTASDFDSGMSKVAAISGAAGEELDRLREKAREMGEKTKFSASEAADAMNYMSMAGWKTEDMLNGIDGVMNLAAASGEDLATTSDIVTDALTAFGMSADQSGHFADVLAAASANANTNVSMMGESFKYVGPVAGAMGYNVEDVSVALGLMANSGIKASNAGTSLRTLLTNMANPTDKMSAAMQTLGIRLDDGQGNMLSFRELLDSLRSGFGDLKVPADEATAAFAQLDQQLADGTIDQKEYDKQVAALTERVFGAEGAMKAQTASMLAGKNGMSGLMALVNASPEDYDKLTQAIDNCSEKFVKTRNGAIMPMSEAMQQGIEWVEEYSGSAEQMASVMNDNLEGQLKILLSQLQELAISFGTIMMPIIREFVSHLQGLVDWLNSLDEGQQKIIITVAAVVAALGPLLIFVGKVMGAVGTIMTWAPQIQAALTMLTTTVIPAIQGALSGLWAVLMANPIILIVAAVAALVVAFIHFWNTSEEFRQFWIDLWENIKSTAIAVWEALSTFFSTAWETITTTAATIWNGLKDFFSGLWEGIKSIFSTVLQAIVTIVTTYFTIYRTVITTILGVIRTVATTVWNGIKTVFKTVLAAIQTIVKTYFTAYKTVITTVFGGIKTVVTTAWTAIRTVFSSALKAVYSTVVSVFRSIFNAIKTVLKSVLTVVKNTFTSVRNYIVGLAKSAYTWGRDLIMGIVRGIRSALSSVKSAATDVANKIKSILHFSVPDEGPLTDYESWMPDFMAGLAKGIQDNRPLVQKAVGDVAEDLSLPEMEPPQVQSLVGGIVENVRDSIGPLREALGSIVLGINIVLEMNQDAVTVEAGKVVEALRTLLQSLRVPVEGSTVSMELPGVRMDDLSSDREVLDTLRSEIADLEMPAYTAIRAIQTLDAQLAAGTITQEEYSAAMDELTTRIFGVENALKAQTAAALMGRDGLVALVALAAATAEEYERLADAATKVKPAELKVPEVPEPELLEPDLPELEYPTPDVPQPDVSEPALPELVYPQPEVPVADVPEPDLPKLEYPTPEMPQPDVSEPALPELVYPQPEVPVPVTPEPELPVLEYPVPEVPSPDVPEPTLPELVYPTPEVPQPDVPELTLPELVYPQPEVPEPDAPEPELPVLEYPVPEVPAPDVPDPALPELVFPAPVVPEPDRTSLVLPDLVLPDTKSQMRDFLEGFMAEIEDARVPLQSAVASLSPSLVVTPQVEVDEGALPDAAYTIENGLLQMEEIVTILFPPALQQTLNVISGTIENSRALLEQAMENRSPYLLLSPKVEAASAETSASEQSSALSSTLVSMLSEYLPYLPRLAQMKVVTDTGALVGELAPRMDERLGLLAQRQRRQ